MFTEFERLAREYTYRTEFSWEDKAFVAYVAEWPSLVAHSNTEDNAIAELIDVVTACLEDMAEHGQTPPKVDL